MAAGSKTWPEGIANTLTAIKVALGDMADNIYMAESKTAVLRPNPALIRGFQQAKTGQIPSLTMDGLGTYDKTKGYPAGSTTLTWQDYTLAYDRARSFDLDAVDIMQEAGQLEAGYVLSEFMRQKVVPEIDALAMSAIAQRVISAQGTVNSTSHKGNNIEYSYTPVAATFISKIVEALNTVRDKTGIEDGYHIFVNGAYRAIIESSTEVQKIKDVGQLSGVDTRTPRISGQDIIWMPEARMYANFTLKDGVTDGQTAGGFAPAATNPLKLAFIITAPDAAMCINAYQATKVIGSADNQTADGTRVMFRSYFDTIVPDNKRDGCYACIVDAKPTQ